jgi:selenocysteine lyase/cysteine desulfurase
VRGQKDDVVFFAGSGCTAATALLVNVLKVRELVVAGTPPVVFLGPYEHHSNMLPWRESGATTITIREAEGGGVDLQHLEELLKEHASVGLKVEPS